MQLRPNEIHVWSAHLNLDHGELLKLERNLSAEEINRATRFKFEEHRQRFIAAHGILRRLLSFYLNIPPKQLIFSYTEHKKPYLLAYKNVCFNLSHSDAIALYGFTLDQELGVDIEKREENKDILALAKRFFSNHEYDLIIALEKSQHTAGFYRLWAKKEAFLKATGQGFSIPLNSFNLSLAETDVIQYDTQKWYIQSIFVDPLFEAAIASNQPIKKIMNYGFYKIEDSHLK